MLETPARRAPRTAHAEACGNWNVGMLELVARRLGAASSAASNRVRKCGGVPSSAARKLRGGNVVHMAHCALSHPADARRTRWPSKRRDRAAHLASNSRCLSRLWPSEQQRSPLALPGSHSARQVAPCSERSPAPAPHELLAAGYLPSTRLRQGDRAAAASRCGRRRPVQGI
eukprot:352988-Chlamydomonas_euryale.AAC.7